jgi:hypothetical protein
LRPVLAETFALADGRTAYESNRSPRRPGKTVLVVRGHTPMDANEPYASSGDGAKP